MKTIIAAILMIASASVMADQYVRGYTRSDGTYVAPYSRSEQNSNRYDNYSSQGNSNPYTGERGSSRNEFSNPPAYNSTNPYAPPQSPYRSR